MRQENVERLKRGENPKPVPERLMGSHKTDLYGQYLARFFEDVDAVKAELKENDAGAYGRVVKHIKSNDKASAAERRALMDEYMSNMDGKWSRYKAEEARGIEMTHVMKGGVLIRLLTMKHNMMTHVDE